MSILDKIIEAEIHNYGDQYQTKEDCIQNMQLRFYALTDTPWIIDPNVLKNEGHISVPENEWKNYNHPPYAIFYEEDTNEGKVYIKHIFHLNIH